jgi:hypothetical protein
MHILLSDEGSNESIALRYCVCVCVPINWGFDSRLVHDRELQLHDGRRLVRYDRFDEHKTRYSLSEEQLHDSGLLRIHPAFRIVALAEPPSQGMVSPGIVFNLFCGDT